MSKFDELKKLAEAATPGPWAHGPFGGVYLDHATGSDGMEYGGYGLLFAEKGDSTLRNSFNNEAYAAAANPAAILELWAIQAQLVRALQVMLPKVRGLDDEGPSNEGWQSDELEQAIRDADAALAAAGAQP